MQQNHVIDPTYFYDAIEWFAFNYDWYAVAKVELDDLGKKVTKYDKKVIRGSLQTQGTALNQSLDGNSENNEYNFYCKSTFRIDIGDFIFYKGKWLHCFAYHDYDEWGVRQATMRMVNLNNYRDFKDYLLYLNGGKTV